MKDLWKRVWYSEPVILIGSLVGGWTALTAFDKATDDFSLPLWSYITATALIPILTGLVRGKVTPTGGE